MPVTAQIPPHRPFGAVITAMATPFTDSGDVDFAACGDVASFLVESGCDALVLNGTTGESPTTTLDEKLNIIRAVRAAVGSDVPLLSGLGSYNTAADVEVVKQTSDLVDGLLVLPPYYSKPTQEGVYRHFMTLADAAEKPIMIYDIPGRTAVEVATETLIRLAEHDKIVAVKDAKDDLYGSSKVMAETDLAYYSGSDQINLMHLANGAAGFVSVVGHVAARQLSEMVALFDAGRVAQALTVQRGLIPAIDAMMTLVPGAVSAKAGLQIQGVISNRTVRAPMIEADESVLETIRSAVNSLQ